MSDVDRLGSERDLNFTLVRECGNKSLMTSDREIECNLTDESTIVKTPRGNALAVFLLEYPGVVSIQIVLKYMGIIFKPIWFDFTVWDKVRK